MTASTTGDLFQQSLGERGSEDDPNMEGSRGGRCKKPQTQPVATTSPWRAEPP
jgi:hypothetical protein